MIASFWSAQQCFMTESNSYPLQVEKLVPQNFPDIYSLKEMNEIPRYLRAMEVRVERGVYNLEKDEEKSKLVEEYEKILGDMLNSVSPYASTEKKEGIEQLRWMIEEYRVSVFAQELGTAFPVSAKRLKKHIEQLERIV